MAVNALTLYFGLWALCLSVMMVAFNIAFGEYPKELKPLLCICLVAAVICDVFRRQI